MAENVLSPEQEKALLCSLNKGLLLVSIPNDQEMKDLESNVENPEETNNNTTPVSKPEDPKTPDKESKKRESSEERALRKREERKRERRR